MTSDRRYDVVLLGATGFTGALTAQYLAKHAPTDLKWALAGRNQAKLESVRSDLGVDVDLLSADVEEPESLRAVAESARIVVTTVGPYLRYGEPLVAACAEAGTDYLDLTGESEFVDRMYVKYHARAVQTGARLIHCCGFDSIPYDLGVQYTVEQLPRRVPIKVEGLVRAGGKPSGGTFQTVITALSRSKQNVDAHRARRRAEQRPGHRSVKLSRERIHRSQGFWAVPLPTVDPQVVRHSALLLDEYGPAFTYSHNAAVKRLPMVAGGIAGMGLLAVAAQIPPARNALLNRIKAGDGPSAERRAKSWFKVRFVGAGGGKRVITEVAGGDPGYEETAKMLGECALSLALDNLPTTAGQVTTAAAMGPALRDRLVAAGITFRVISTEDY
ncbi:Saccharopine dehydrogenase (NAD(+), L-glutamate-forming) [Kribbella flavida DSM 17836]|uniref:Saccharopine dehydrogenase (NAD(+), L-glutamate-forming) n=1 Tax=Kribbella flavida (strain DSM 17836 / JCM 10339 / NBRC 14399) TaxID=479435 RepID=D2PL09_KRIFD|nr:saccharopine dehydrogenase NADP-binding domain-containing protein [Kribbella flavida]ADB32476.1 Saccharopine dehydrogenase (NAD(+), L-glutamate-forming) [Kribbella flavida DSM 17836]